MSDHGSPTTSPDYHVRHRSVQFHSSIITATQPPPETTYVDLVLAKASPDTGAPGGEEILCFY